MGEVMRTKVWATDEPEPPDGCATNPCISGYPPTWFDNNTPMQTADLYVLERWHCKPVGPVDVYVRDEYGLHKFKVTVRATVESTVIPIEYWAPLTPPEGK